jgi:hypothetical protein
MPVTGRQKPVVNGKKGKFSFITLVDSQSRFVEGSTKCTNPVTDNHAREFTGKVVRVRSATELRLRLKCDKERVGGPKKTTTGDPDPGTLTITLSNPNVVDIQVPVDYVEDDEM